MYRKLLILSIFLPMIGCAEGVEPVSMVQLLSLPSKLEGKKIRVFGYMHSEVNIGLYLTKEHAVSRDFMSSIAIQDKSKNGLRFLDCINGWKYVEGTLESREKVYRIVDIKFIKHPDWSNCWSPEMDKLEKTR